MKEKRARFLARAATANWDAIIITHSAFRFIAVPAAFERGMIEDQIAMLRGAAHAAVDERRPHHAQAPRGDEGEARRDGWRRCKPRATTC